MTESDAVVVHPPLSAGDAPVVRVQLTPEDFAAFHRHATKRALGPQWRICMAVAGAFLGFSMLFVPSLLGVTPRAVNMVVLSLAIGSLPFVFLFVFGSQAKRFRMLEPNGFCMRPQDVTLSSQGISFKNDVSVAICDWRAFLRVDETPTHIFLFYDRLMAHI